MKIGLSNSYNPYNPANNKKVSFKCNVGIVNRIVDTFARKGDLDSEEFAELVVQTDGVAKSRLQQFANRVTVPDLRRQLEKFWELGTNS